ncbi:MAG: hypothetical protein ABI647_01800 [Gemmatimonadota bacterium]
MRIPIIAVAALALAACGGKDRGAVQDSVGGRDLSLAPVDSNNALNDRPGTPPPKDTATAAPAPAPPPPPPEAPPPPPPPSRPKPRPPASTPSPAPAPAPEPAPAPAPPPAPVVREHTAPSGTVVTLRMTEGFTSENKKVGNTVHATVSSDVTDADGTLVIPAGSDVTLTITQLARSENKDDPGKLALTPVRVMVNGNTYDVSGSVSEIEHTLKGRGIKAGDAAKVGAGAAAGAILGRVLGGKSKGTIVGGVIGAAAGTAVAVNSADRDMVVPAGAKLILRLTSSLVVKA